LPLCITIFQSVLTMQFTLLLWRWKQQVPLRLLLIYCITQWHIPKDSNLLFFPLFYAVKTFKLLNFIIQFPSFHCLNVFNDVFKMPYRIKQSSHSLFTYSQTLLLLDDTVVFSFVVYYTHLSCVWLTDLYFHFHSEKQNVWLETTVVSHIVSDHLLCYISLTIFLFFVKHSNVGNVHK